MAQQVKMKFVKIPLLNKNENYITVFILALLAYLQNNRGYETNLNFVYISVFLID